MSADNAPQTRNSNNHQEQNMTGITAYEIEDPVAHRLAKANDAIAFWKAEIVAQPEVTDQILDRLRPHLRDRDHLMSLTEAERSRAAEIWKLMHSSKWRHMYSDRDVDECDAAIREFYAIMGGAA